MPHVAVLVHRHDPFESTNYYMRGMVTVWREMGLEVTVCHGPEEAVDADLAILHVDLTVVPPEYLALAYRYPICLNRFTPDISKRSISRNLVHLGDGYDGPVIVKSNKNSGGRREALLAARLSGSREPPAVFGAYEVLESPSRVPPEIWHEPELVVERFVCERQGDLYCTRIWILFGDSELGTINYATTPIVKADTTVRRELLSDVPDELRQIREELGFDYGKFDYAVVDGRAVLFDANRTPGGTHDPELNAERSRILSEGIWRHL